MFHPPRCPYTRCSEHRTPRARFYRRNGYYSPECRPYPLATRSTDWRGPQGLTRTVRRAW